HGRGHGGVEAAVVGRRALQAAALLKAGDLTGQLGVDLGLVQAPGDQRAAVTVDLEAGAGVADQHAGVQDNPQPAVAEHQVDVVDGLDLGALDAQVGPDGPGRTEQDHDLVDQVGPEVPEEAR